MNRKKKINQILKARAKKANAKLVGPKKERYISKAEREKLAAEQTAETADTLTVSEANAESAV